MRSGLKFCAVMLEDIKAGIEKLVSAYEAEKETSRALNEELRQAKVQNENYRKQITELEKKIDNLKLSEAFIGTSGNGEAARERIDRMIREIDKCISLMEG